MPKCGSGKMASKGMGGKGYGKAATMKPMKSAMKKTTARRSRK